MTKMSSPVHTLKVLDGTLDVYQGATKVGIRGRTAFDEKELGNYAVDFGFRCGHACVYGYCRQQVARHGVFKQLGLAPADDGYAIVDPDTATRVRRKLPKLRESDVVTLGTYTDGWSPEAREYGVGRSAAEVILTETPATIRVLTKSAHVVDDYDLFVRFPGRVIVGLSTGIPASRQDIAAVLEPNASTVAERLDALRKAHDMGLRTFGMLCPLFPEISDSPNALHETFERVVQCGVERIWVEPLNHRGGSFARSAAALSEAGLTGEAEGIAAVMAGGQSGFSDYVVGMTRNAISVANKLGCGKLVRVMIYANSVSEDAKKKLEAIGASSILWL